MRSSWAGPRSCSRATTCCLPSWLCPVHRHRPRPAWTTRDLGTGVLCRPCPSQIFDQHGAQILWELAVGMFSCPCHHAGTAQPTCQLPSHDSSPSQCRTLKRLENSMGLHWS